MPLLIMCMHGSTGSKENFHILIAKAEYLQSMCRIECVECYSYCVECFSKTAMYPAVPFNVHYVASYINSMLIIIMLSKLRPIYAPFVTYYAFEQYSKACVCTSLLQLCHSS